jgi:hypothetical protein
MSSVAGVVQSVTKNDHGFYSVKMDDGRYYGMGKKSPGITQGQRISFEFTTKDDKYHNLTFGTLKVLEGDTASNGAGLASADNTDRSFPVRSNGAVAGKSIMSKDDYWRAKEERDIQDAARRETVRISTQNEIRIQASRNAAV